MKKTALVLIVLAGCGLTHGQSLSFSTNFGVLTADDFKFNPLFLSGGITLDFHLGSFIMISPECTFYTNSKFNSYSMTLAPGATVNFKSGPLFFGAGIVKEIWLKSTSLTIPLEMKLQVGLHAANIRLGAYMLTVLKEMFDSMAFGFTIGFEM